MAAVIRRFFPFLVHRAAHRWWQHWLVFGQIDNLFSIHIDLIII
jgi:hypothetical protein